MRITSSGAGCGNHWPLCNGEVLPHHPRLATLIEFAHRSLTGLSTLMFVVLVAWTFRQTDNGHPARSAALAAGLLLLTEGALGAVLVKGGYVEQNASPARVLVQSIHFTNTLLLLGATTAVAVLLRPFSWVRRIEHKTSIFLALAAFIVTGATGSVAALADTLFPSPSLGAAIAADFAASSPLLLRMRWMHPAATVTLAAAGLWLALQYRSANQRFAFGLILANVLSQMSVGAINVLLLAPAWIQVLHLLGADLFWITLVALAVPTLWPESAKVPETF